MLYFFVVSSCSIFIQVSSNRYGEIGEGQHLGILQHTICLQEIQYLNLGVISVVQILPDSSGIVCTIYWNGVNHKGVDEF